MFDMDVYWMFGEVDVDSKVVDNWSVLQVGEDKKGLSSPEGGRRHLFIGLMTDKMKHAQGEGHLLLQQNLTVDAPEEYCFWDMTIMLGFTTSGECCCLTGIEKVSILLKIK